MEPVPQGYEIRSMSFTPTIEENAEQSVFSSEKSMRVIQVTYISLGLISIFLGLAIPAFDAGFLGEIAGTLVFFGVAMAALGAGMKWFGRTISRPFLSGAESRNHSVPRTVRASDEAIVIDYETGMALRFPWSTIVKVRRGRLAVYLMVTRQFFVVVPDRAFPEDEMAREFISLCSRKVVDNNFQKLNKQDRAILE